MIVVLTVDGHFLPQDAVREIKIRKKKYEKKKERTELISHMYVAHKVKREILIKDVWETKA